MIIAALSLAAAQPVLMSHEANKDFERYTYAMLEPVRSQRPRECRKVRIDIDMESDDPAPFAFTCIGERDAETPLAADTFDTATMAAQLPGLAEELAEAQKDPVAKLVILMDRRGRFRTQIHRRYVTIRPKR